MVFKQSFKYLNNEKNNFIKVILKLEYLLYQNFFFPSYCILSHLDSNKCIKKVEILIEKKAIF